MQLSARMNSGSLEPIRSPSAGQVEDEACPAQIYFEIRDSTQRRGEGLPLDAMPELRPPTPAFDDKDGNYEVTETATAKQWIEEVPAAVAARNPRRARHEPQHQLRLLV